MEQLETKLKVSNISKTFFNKKDYFTAIEDVSFDVKDGEFLCNSEMEDVERPYF